MENKNIKSTSQILRMKGKQDQGMKKGIRTTMHTVEGKSRQKFDKNFFTGNNRITQNPDSKIKLKAGNKYLFSFIMGWFQGLFSSKLQIFSSLCISNHLEDFWSTENILYNFKTGLKRSLRKIQNRSILKCKLIAFHLE